MRGVSKDFFDAHRLSGGGTACLPNAPAGFRALSKWLGEDIPSRVVFEAIGPYHRHSERSLSRQLTLVKVNPLQARRFAQACGTRVKTDAVDARMLARFGSALTLEPDTPIDEKQYELRELFSARGSLVKDRIRLKNRLQTQTLALVKRQTKARIEQLTRQLEAIQQDINSRFQECPQRARANNILPSIPGIGEVAALTILIELPEVGTLRKKKAASLTGLAPPLVHVNMRVLRPCRAMDDPTIRKVAWQSAHSRWAKTAARRALHASSRRGQTQP
jgi:transposase